MRNFLESCNKNVHLNFAASFVEAAVYSQTSVWFVAQVVIEEPLKSNYITRESGCTEAFV